jgi:hypothetical protein
MDWRILVLYPEPEALKLKTHSGFHNLFRF